MVRILVRFIVRGRVIVMVMVGVSKALGLG